MTLLKYSDITKMDKKQRNEKLKELKFELTKANVTANKASAKTKEIKRAIARLLTFNTSNKEVLKQK
jgi:ribosomal protein L29